MTPSPIISGQTSSTHSYTTMHMLNTQRHSTAALRSSSTYFSHSLHAVLQYLLLRHGPVTTVLATEIPLLLLLLPLLCMRLL
jgi:hypothetical protein